MSSDEECEKGYYSLFKLSSAGTSYPKWRPSVLTQRKSRNLHHMVAPNYVAPDNPGPDATNLKRQLAAYRVPHKALLLIQGRLAKDTLDVYFSYDTPSLAKLWAALELAYGVHNAVKQDELERNWGRLLLRNFKKLDEFLTTSRAFCRPTVSPIS
jgi:hypothetical protein